MKLFAVIILLSVVSNTAWSAVSQRGVVRSGGNNTIYGDVKVHHKQSADNLSPLALDVLLYSEAGSLVSRQTVQSNGRYRFNNLIDGRYQIVIEVENNEVARFPVDFSSPLKNEFRQDLEFDLREPSNTVSTGTVSVAYNRPAENVPEFDRASDAMKKRHYDEALSLLRKIVESDEADFQAWERLGTLYFIQKNFAEAEKSYLEALKHKTNYGVVLISLGRLRIAQKNFDGAVQVLSQAVKVEPRSAQANYFLGEAFLQLKKGSKAVSYLYEALKLDPKGMAEAHLRLAALYHGAGMKDKAALEYEEFLKKVPGYPDRENLEQYIKTNKKR